MADPRLIGVVGRKGAGKTTLLVALAGALARKHRVATLKHGHHPASADHEGKDTWRHVHEGGAVRTLLESPGQRALFERTEREADPFTLARTYLAEADVILIEGFTRFPIPKIEAHRTALGQPPLVGSEPAVPGPWLALVTDDPTAQAPCPVFRFSDTSWLQALTALALDGALPLSDAP